MHRCVAIVFVLALVANLSLLGRGAELTLDITRKLGGQERAVIVETAAPVEDEYRRAFLRRIGAHSFNFQDQSKGFLTIDVGNNTYILVPWALLKEAIAERKQHIVKLSDGTEYTGTLLTEVTDDKTNKYVLSAASRISLIKSAGAEPAKNNEQREQRQPMSLVIDALKGKSLDVTFLGFYKIEPSGYINRGPSADKAGESFQIKVDGETLEGKVTLFSKLVFQKGKTDGGWRLTIESPTVTSTEGVFVPPASRWGFLFSTSDGCRIAVMNPTGTVTLSTIDVSKGPKD